MIVTAYPRIHFDVHLRQHKKHTVCLFVVLKATEGRKVHKRDNCISAKLNAGLGTTAMGWFIIGQYFG